MKLLVPVMVLLTTGCATSGQLQQANTRIDELSARVQVLEKQQAHTRTVLNGVIQYLKEDSERLDQ